LPPRALLAISIVGLASIDAPLFAQFGPRRVAPGQLPEAEAAVREFGPRRVAPGAETSEVPKLKEPAAWQVFQRDANGRAEITLSLDEPFKDAAIVQASVVNANGTELPGTKVTDGKLVGVPTGGPYRISCRVDLGKHKRTEAQAKAGLRLPPVTPATVYPVFVGDLWVLAGQSNMQGVGDLIDVTPPHGKVALLGMDGKWAQAEEPLHWLLDSPDPVHHGDPRTRAERSAKEHKTRKKGTGLGLPFAVAMVEATGVPVGLVACAHGGTSMAQWNPALKEQGGGSLYGSMLRQVSLAGGKAKGVLWYQGESDTGKSETWSSYPRVFSDFITAVRSDFGQPELPFYYVQIGRFVAGGDPEGWNAVQDAQRVLAERVANAAVVSVIDLELDDGIHVGTQGLKRAGQRLARVALRELFGQVGATTPALDRVTSGPDKTLRVKFRGVNMGAGRPAAMGMGARGGMGGMGGMTMSLAEASGVGLRPERHIAGFSIRKEDGTLLPLIYEACLGNAKDTVVLKLNDSVPGKSALWYGYGLDPYCNLTDGLDMAVPVFGPIVLDGVAGPAPAVAAAGRGAQASQPPPIRLLIITGDHGHAWKDTTKVLSDFLGAGGRIKVDVTTSPSKDLTDDNLTRYDVLLLNYKDTANGPPESRWSEANKEAFLKAVREGKGLVVYHHASSAFTKPNWDEFEKAIAGGWRSQGYHGPKHVFVVKKTHASHPISDGLPAEFEHIIDELYQNSVMMPGSEVLATAYSDPQKPRGTGKDEPVIWVNSYGKGRVYENVLGHDVAAMADPKFQDWMRRGVIWAATGKVD
jgi:sialate O-acetylesterase